MILDTNGLSALADGDPALEAVLDASAELAIPAIVLGEYLYGIRQSRRVAAYQRWLASLIAATPVLNVDRETADHYAEIRAELKKAGRPIPSNDLWIAALSRQYSMPLVSRDLHFDAVPKLHRIAW